MLIIKTDHKWRDLKYGYEVPSKVLAREFDYMEYPLARTGFFKYKNWWFNEEKSNEVL